MAFEVAERIRVVVEQSSIAESLRSPDGRFTVSLGISSFPDDATEPDELIRRADLALYLAKAGGRNRVSGYDNSRE